MSNIKNLQMWNDICTDARINIRKSLLGLKTTVVYLPTLSIIDAKILEYSATDGNHLRHIINTPREQLVKVIGEFHPKEVTNGNYMLEVAKSRDKQFIAMRLLQFTQLSYEAVTETLIFEGDEARIINQMFLD